MRRAALAALAGCGFTGPRLGGDDAGPHDAALTADVPRAVDAAMSFVDATQPVVDASPDAPSGCTVTTQATAAGSSLGNPNVSGSPTPEGPFTCPPDERVVGMQFDYTTSAPSWSQLIVVGTTLRCGTIKKLPTGAYTTMVDPTTIGFVSPVACGTWSANQTGTERDCPDGQVVISATGNEAYDQNNLSRRAMFDHVVVRCAPFRADGTADNTATTALVFTETGNDTGLPQSAGCATGQSVVGISAMAGCGEDSMTLLCASTSCD